MQSQGLWISALAFVVGVGGGIVGTSQWNSSTKSFSAGGPQRAKITMTRDACCPGEGSDANTHDAHDDHDEHGGHNEHAECAEHGGHSEAASCGRETKRKIKLSAEAVQRFGIQLADVAAGEIEQRVVLPAEIVLNADHVAHLVPRVTGMVREVRKMVGDRVEAGELLAVLDSRELAEAKAADLAAEARLKVAEANFKRVQRLLEEKIASERQFFEAQQAVEEVRIAHLETTAKLHALGVHARSTQCRARRCRSRSFRPI